MVQKQRHKNIRVPVTNLNIYSMLQVTFVSQPTTRVQCTFTPLFHVEFCSPLTIIAVILYPFSLSIQGLGTEKADLNLLLVLLI